jgi:uncharacterized protein YxeA
MEINWNIVGVVILFVMVLIAFLIWNNPKDKKKYSNFLKKDYKKSEEDSGLDDDTY